MIRRVLFVFFLIASVFVLVRHGENRRAILRDGTEMLLPVYVRKTERSGRALQVRFHYYSLVPAAEIGTGGDTAVVHRHAGGRVSFVRMFDPSVPLRPREHLLRFRLSHKAGWSRSTESSRVDFASDVFTLRSADKTDAVLKRLKSAGVRFAVLKVDENGNAVLKGLADQNGVTLCERD